MTSTARKHGPALINFRTPTNPHGLRFADGDGGAAGQGGGAAGDGQQQGQDGGQGDGKPADAPKPAPPANAPQNGQGDGKQGDAAEGKVEDLPAWAQALIGRTRDEAAKSRTNAKEQAAKDAEQALIDKFMTALGRKPEGEEKVDPDKLAADLQASQGAQRDTAVELAIYKAAAAAGADPAKLTDSRAFMQSVPKDLDPTDTAALAQLVKDAVEKNPTLKAARVAGASSADTAGGSGDGVKREPSSLADAVAQHYRAG